MRLVSIIVAGGTLAAGIAPAFADTLTSRVVAWNPATKYLLLEDRSQMQVDPQIVPAELAPGREVTITFQSDEDGVTSVQSVLVTR